MARTIHSTQTTLLRRTHITPVQLVRIDTVGTDTYRWSDRTVIYDSVTYEPRVTAISPLREGISHLPSPSNSFSRPLRIDLANLLPGGGYLATELEANDRLEGASIEVWEILVGETVGRTVPRLDLSSLGGTEHTVFYRGRIERVGPTTTSGIQLQCDLELPQIPWTWITDIDEADPKEIGNRAPVVIGRNQVTELVTGRSGRVTTLASEILAADTTSDTFTITDGTGMPTASFQLRVGNEVLDVTRSGETCTIVSRGPRPTLHTPGEYVSELSDARFIASAAPDTQTSARVVSSITDRRVVNENSGLAVTDPSSAGTVTLDALWLDDRDVGYANYGQGDLEQLRDALFSQTSSEADDPPTSTHNEDFVTFADGFDPTWQDNDVFATPGTPKLDWDASGTGEVLKFSFPASSIPAGPLGKTIKRWRITFNGEFRAPGASASSGEFIDHYFGRVSGAASLGGVIMTTSTVNALAVLRLYKGDTDGFYDETSSKVLFNSWVMPTDHVVEDLEGIEFALGAAATSTTALSWLLAEFDAGSAQIGLEIEYFNTDPELQDPNLVGSAVGYGLRIFADVVGPSVPSSDYTEYVSGALEDTAITNPESVLRYFLEEVCGEAVNATSYDAAETNEVGGDANRGAGVDLRSMGFGFEEVLAALAYEYRINVIRRELSTGSEWFLLSGERTAGNDYEYTGSISTVAANEFRNYAVLERDLNELKTRWLVFRGLDPLVRSETGEAFPYRESYRVDPDQSDVSGPTTAELTTAESTFGRRDADPLFFNAWQHFIGGTDENVRDIVQFYAQEAIRVDSAAVHAIDGIPFFSGRGATGALSPAYVWEAGDIITVTVPWESSTTVLRLLEVEKDFDSGLISIVGVETA